jgi:hypothetical protein
MAPGPRRLGLVAKGRKGGHLLLQCLNIGLAGTQKPFNCRRLRRHGPHIGLALVNEGFGGGQALLKRGHIGLALVNEGFGRGAE